MRRLVLVKAAPSCMWCHNQRRHDLRVTIGGAFPQYACTDMRRCRAVQDARLDRVVRWHRGEVA